MKSPEAIDGGDGPGLASSPASSGPGLDRGGSGASSPRTRPPQAGDRHGPSLQEPRKINAMEARRLRFMAALTVFLIWVVGLGVLAAKSGRRPMARPSAPVIPAK